MIRRPYVYIVGAGPGDPGLISVRGMRRLAIADVVLYDHRVQERLLRLAAPDAERIDVGPAAPRAMEQDAISMLIAEKAREGKAIVHLKWGDPYFFDSGGKEALFLHEQGIPFEVIPGVPAGIGSLSYAGIPVTYPGGGDVLTFIRGHESETNDLPHVDWKGVASLEGTIVCYAGAGQIAGVLRNLLSHGRPETDNAALVFRGTLPGQRTVQGTLADIATGVSNDPPENAAILVVGAVAGLREHLRWFDDRPLFGKRIVVTRSREQAGELVELLEELGAEPIQAPAIRIAPPDDLAPLDRAAAEVGTFDWVIFTSANGVDAFVRRILEGAGDVRDLKGVRICTIGPSTAGRLSRYGIKVDLTPEEYRAEAIVEALRARGEVQGKRFLLPRADIARELLAEELRRHGADVVEVTAYRTEQDAGSRNGDPDIYRMLLDRRIDAVTFTSASTVRNFVKMLGEEPAADLLKDTVVASIGPVTAEAAQVLGIATTVMPSEYTIPALVEALVDHFSKT
ncbi:MAG TPA: uroporphyrinogen-III C-methyltransferase [Vicinamibacterales bacterium]|nr:uroporphyrinogen-III C-methyltransferase [Vicinamibacterales bacterium]